MGFFNKIVDFIAKASLPTYKFENNQLHFKLKTDEYFDYDLENYEMKTRHDPYALEAYTIRTNNIFLEYIRLDNNASWNGQPLSIYQGFLKEKLNIKDFELLEKEEINNYNFKTYKIDKSFILHIIYIYTSISDIIIIDTSGNLYKNLLSKLDEKYLYKFDKEEKGSVNFNISIVRENCFRNYIGYDND